MICGDAVLDDLEGEGFRIRRESVDSYWNSYQVTLHGQNGLGRPRFDLSGRNQVTLGFLGSSHLGDVLCTTPLARLIRLRFGAQVFVVRHRSTYKAFANNPYLSGHSNEQIIPLSEYAQGPGHIIQKLMDSFGLGIDPFPKPEVFLTSEETKWAWEERSHLPRNKPVAFVSLGSITEGRLVRRNPVIWQRIVDCLRKRYTVVQLALTKIAPLDETIRVDEAFLRRWQPDPVLENCMVYENLGLRRFLSLFSVADLFVGVNSGGMHAAAAFDVPSLIVLDSSRYGDYPVFPVMTEGRWTGEAFLYPQHTFIFDRA